MKKKEIEKILKNLHELEEQFELIDEQIDESLTVSKKTLETMITL